MNGICRGCLYLFADGCRSASLRCCFSLFARHAWCSESVRVDCCAWCAVLVHETHLSVVFKARLSLLSGSSLMSLMYRHIWILTGQIVSECSEVWWALWFGWSEILLHSSRGARVIVNHTPFARVISVRFFTSVVYICMECLERKTEQLNSTNVNAFSNTFNRHQEFVATDAISWR